MDILFHVGTSEGGRLLAPLARACARAGAEFGCFFTHAGVLALGDDAVREAVVPAREAVVCEESWHRFRPGATCPVELGSQTANSAMVGRATRIVSL